MRKSKPLHRPVKRRRSYSKRRMRRLLVTIGVLWSLYVFLGGDYGLVRIISLKRQVARAENKIIELKARKIVLERECELLEGDSATIERIARERLGMIKD